MRPETRLKIQRQVEALRKQMRQASNDLEYESQLRLVRDLEHLLTMETAGEAMQD